MERIVQAQSAAHSLNLLCSRLGAQHQPRRIAQHMGEEEDSYHQPEQDDDGVEQPSHDIAADGEPPSTRVEWSGLRCGEETLAAPLANYSPSVISFTSMNPSRRGVHVTPSLRP